MCLRDAKLPAIIIGAAWEITNRIGQENGKKAQRPQSPCTLGSIHEHRIGCSKLIRPDPCGALTQGQKTAQPPLTREKKSTVGGDFSPE